MSGCSFLSHNSLPVLKMRRALHVCFCEERCTCTETKHVARGSNSAQCSANLTKSSCVMTSRSLADAASKPSRITPINRFMNTYVTVSVKLQAQKTKTKRKKQTHVQRLFIEPEAEYLPVDWRGGSDVLGFKFCPST